MLQVDKREEVMQAIINTPTVNTAILIGLVAVSLFLVGIVFWLVFRDKK